MVVSTSAKGFRSRKGSEADLDKLLDLCDNIMGRSFCALADGAASPIISSLKYFRQEYLDHLSAGACPFDPMAALYLRVQVLSEYSRTEHRASS